MAAAVYTTDFHEEYQAETSRLIRDRFVWFAVATTGFTLIFSLQSLWQEILIPVTRVIRGLDATGWHWGKLVGALPDTLTIALFGYLGWRAWVGKLENVDLQRMARAMIQVAAGFAMVLYPIYQKDNLLPIERVFIMHVAACACLPWNLRDALRPTYPLLALNFAIIALVSFWGGVTFASVRNAVLAAAFSPFILAPGALIAFVKDRWRTELFRTRFFEARYGQMRRELVDARKLHEALFPTPTPQHRGLARFDYRYEPMRQIGGDFLLARWDTSQGEDKPRLNLVLLDVTGHGISSALTVNRLAGELERLYAEDPDASPSKVLCALNKYVYLTLANHALYCTAMCIRLDPYEHATSSSQSTRAHADENAPNAARSGILRVASGGHPPAFLRTPAASRDGSQQNAAVRVIESTAPMLGVLGPEDFSVDETVLTIREGETLIALTDGAVETRNDAGALFSERRVLQFLQRSQTPVGGWCQGLLSEVDAFRVGAPSDDTVVVEVSIDASTTKPT